MSDQQSNESSVSSPHSSVGQDLDDTPAFITIEERLPTFAEATAIHLPRVVVPDQDPLSFRLSTALQENDQEFPPVSPQTAEVLLCTHPDINEAIHAVAYGLIATIHCQTLASSQELDASCTREQQLHHQLITHGLEITCLQGRLGTVDIPARFEPNLGHVADTVPLSTGKRVIPQFVRRLGTGEVKMLTRHKGNEAIYVAQLILTPNCTLPTAEPLQLWFSNLLTSMGDKFDTLAKAAYKLDDWATHAEIMQYHRINTEHCEIEEEMAILWAHLSLNNEALDS